MRDNARFIKQYEKADDLILHGDVSAALYIFKKLDKEGVESAAYEIANIYEHGGGDLSKDHKEAIKWYEKSLSQRNDDFSMFGLARIYFNDLHTNNNSEKAYGWFYKLRNSNQPGALYALGILRESGTGIRKNKEKALEYYEKSARFGHLLALNRYGVLLIKSGAIIKGTTLVLKSRVRAMKAYKENNYRVDWRLAVKKVMDPESLTISIKL